MEGTLWEYAALYDVEAPTDPDSLLYRIDPPSGHVGDMPYAVRWVRSGEQLEVEVYQRLNRATEAEHRRKMERLTPAQMTRVNAFNAEKKLTRLMNENFTAQDIHLTLTFAEAASQDESKKAVRNFLRRVKRLREKRGLPEAKYIYVIEDREDGQKKRAHCHMLISGGIRREELEQLWGRGWANADRLQPDKEGLRALARYLLKQRREERERYTRRWSCSKNLKQPRVRVTNSKLSNRKVKRLAEGIENVSKEVLERAFPGWSFVSCSVRYSDWVQGVYIWAELQRAPHPLTPSRGRGNQIERRGNLFPGEKIPPVPHQKSAAAPGSLQGVKGGGI